MPTALPLRLVVEEYARDLRWRETSPKTMRGYRQALVLANRPWAERLGPTHTSGCDTLDGPSVDALTSELPLDNIIFVTKFIF